MWFRVFFGVMSAKKISVVRAMGGVANTSTTNSVVAGVLQDQLEGQLRLTGMVADATGDTAGGEITLENQRTTNMDHPRRNRVKEISPTTSGHMECAPDVKISPNMARSS